jgi:transposase
MCRPTKLTPELQKEIVGYIEAGNYIEVACEAAGISQSTFFDWKARGAKKQPLYSEFLEAVKKAESKAEIRNVVVIQKAAQENWQASAWYLERKHAERWGRKDQLLMKMLKMTDEEIDAILAGSKNSEAD